MNREEKQQSAQAAADLEAKAQKVHSVDSVVVRVLPIEFSSEQRLSHSDSLIPDSQWVFCVTMEDYRSNRK